MYTLLLISAAFTIFAAREVLVHSLQKHNKSFAVSNAVLVAAILGAVWVVVVSYATYQSCGGYGACGWIFVGTYGVFILFYPIGLLAALALLIYWAKRGDGRPQKFTFLKINLGLLILLIVYSALYAYYNSAPSRNYEELVVDKQAQATSGFGDLRKLYNIETIENSGSFDDFTVRVNSSGNVTMTYLYNVREELENGRTSTRLFLAEKDTQGQLLQECDLQQLYVRDVEMKIGDKKLYPQDSSPDVFVAGITSQDKPFLVVRDLENCRVQKSTVNFEKVEDRFNERVVNLLTNESDVSFHLERNRKTCKFSIGVDPSNVCARSDESNQYQDYEIDLDYKRLSIDRAYKIDLNDDESEEFVLFVSDGPTGYSTVPQTMLILNQDKKIISLARLDGKSKYEQFFDIDDDGKKEIIIKESMYDRIDKIIVFGF